MKRRASLGEMQYPSAPGDREKAVAWAEMIVEAALTLVWGGFERLVANDLRGIDVAERDPEQLERELVQLHFFHIQDIWKETFVPFGVGTEVHEFATRSGGNATPTSNDLAFVHNSRRRWKLPVEAKVLWTDRAIAEYLKDIEEKFLPGIAAPFVGEGGQIGYLLSGEEARVFEALRARLNQPLRPVPCFSSRAHRTSTHDRATAPPLRVHHMVMSCVAKAPP